MEGERAIEKLRKGEKVLCPVCKKHYLDNSGDDRQYSNYFHCENENCKGYVHEQKSIDID